MINLLFLLNSFNFSIMNDKITTLIFDLGGVIINIDPSLTIKEFNLLAKRNSDILNGLDYKLFESNKMLNFFFDFEKGLISENNFIYAVIILCGSTFYVIGGLLTLRFLKNKGNENVSTSTVIWSLIFLFPLCLTFRQYQPF